MPTHHYESRADTPLEWREHRREHRQKRKGAGTETGRRGTLPERLIRAYFEEADPLTETLLLSWAAFGATFGLCRLVTHSIRRGWRWLPVKNVQTGKYHLHHYNWGIAMLTAVGLQAVRGTPKPGHRPVTGVAFGAGAALIADEAALLLNLEDVYWHDKGRTSINVVVGILTALGVYVVAEPFFDDAAREIRQGIHSVT